MISTTRLYGKQEQTSSWLNRNQVLPYSRTSKKRSYRRYAAPRFGYSRCKATFTMLAEELISAVSGPPIGANTSVPKDIGIYSHTLAPSWTVKSSFKKSSTPANCMAVSKSHIFTAQDQKAHLHVYSRLRGNQETFISFQERIRSVALAGDVLVLGTAEGRLILWEVRTFSCPRCPCLDRWRSAAGNRLNSLRGNTLETDLYSCRHAPEGRLSRLLATCKRSAPSPRRQTIS